MEEQSGIGRISSSGPHLDYNKHLTCGGGRSRDEGTSWDGWSFIVGKHIFLMGEIRVLGLDLSKRASAKKMLRVRSEKCVYGSKGISLFNRGWCLVVIRWESFISERILFIGWRDVSSCELYESFTRRVVGAVWLYRGRHNFYNLLVAPYSRLVTAQRRE